MNVYDNFSPNFDQNEQIWTSLDMFGQDLHMSRKIFSGGGGWQSLKY